MRGGGRIRAPATGPWTRVLLLVLLLSGCTEPAAESNGLSGRVEITGSSTIAPLLSEIARRFEEEHAGVRVAVHTGGSSRGINDVMRGTADIGMASRMLTGEENERLRVFRLGLDGIALITNRENPVEALTTDLVVHIFTGAVDNWSAVGGHDRSITVVNKADGRATLTVFLGHFGLERVDMAGDLIIGENQHGIRAVAADRGAIGYVSVGAAMVEMNRGTAIRILAIDGVVARLETVRAGDYPLLRELNLVTGAEPTEATQAFLRFARSQGVHDLFEAFGYVPGAD